MDEELMGFFDCFYQLFKILYDTLKIIILSIIIIGPFVLFFGGLVYYWNYAFDYYSDKLKSENEILKNQVFNQTTKLDSYFYLSDNNLQPNFTDPDQLLWSIKNLDYYYGSNLKKKQCKSNLNRFSFNFETLIDFQKFKMNDSIYLHIYIVNNDYLPYFNGTDKLYSKLQTYHKIKELNRFNWITNYTINLLDHKENINLDNQTMSSNLIESNSETNKYYPLMFIDNNSDYLNIQNDQSINKTGLQLNLIFNHVNFCEFISYLCNKVSKNDNYYRICIAEKPKLSQNILIFSFDHYETRFYAALTVIAVTVLLMHYPLRYFKFKNRYPKGLSRNYLFVEFIKIFIFLLYEINRLSILYCSNQSGYEDEIFFQLAIIYFWFFHLLFSLIELLSVNKFEIDLETKKYDNLAYRNLAFILIPLLMGYSYYCFYSFHHKNYYYLIINTLYGYFLNFGFLMMLPQLYINRKLKAIPLENTPYYGYFSFAIIVIAVEDFIDFQNKWREQLKIIYLREELIAIYLLNQYFLYTKRTSKTV